MDREVFSLALSRSDQVRIEPMTSTELNPPSTCVVLHFFPYRAHFGGF